MRISEHVSYYEATKSNTAIKFGIKNKPNNEQLQNMKLISQRIFEPLRNNFNCPIGISSFFRSQELNKKIGGATKSQHCKGEAMDLDADIFGKISNKEIFDFIKNNLDFDQLIWEFGDDNNPNWVHVSYCSNNRNEVLKVYRKNGRSIYEKL